MDPDHEANTTERVGTRATPPGNIADPESRFSWRRWIRPVVYVIYGLLVAAATPFVIIDFSKADGTAEKFKRTLALVGFISMVISLPISLWGIINHMICFTRPSLQKYIIRILLMVPIYVLNSWFALRFPEDEIYFNTIRQLYEAFAVYNFVYYVVAFFDEVPDFDNRLDMKTEIKFPLPLCWKTGVPNKGMIRKCKLGVLNYTVIRIIVTIVTIVTHITGSYHNGDFSTKNAYLWVTIIITISQIWAMFCKNLLRRATLDELKLLPRSTLQFVGIQLVVFVTNFQSTLLNILAQTGVLKPNPAWGFEDEFAFASMLQDFLICIEMVVYAAIFTYSFDYQRYDTDEPKLGIAQICKHMSTIYSVMEHLRKGNDPESHPTTNPVQSQQAPTVNEVRPPTGQRVV